jgi:Reverse transcriptase (RNA-dependent DNA polymerase)
MNESETNLKVRLVAKGFSQIQGIGYHETYAPVVRYTSIRCLMALAVQQKMYIHQIDAVTAFLQGDLSEEIYMNQPDRFNDGTE